MDAVTYVQDSFGGMCYQIYVEGKSTADAEYIPDRIKSAFQHQDSKAKVTFIVTSDPPEKRMCAKDLIEDSRVFFVEIDEFHKVVLRSIDGKPDEETAERVIFVISRDEINSRFK